MSHVMLYEADTADQQIKDIAALARAAQRCGLEFREDQTHFRTWATDHGKLVGDWATPVGWTEAEVKAGHCLHAIGIPGMKGKTGTQGYEIGVVPSKKYEGTYSLVCDWYGGALSSRVSSGARDTQRNPKMDKLQMFYQIEAARGVAVSRGMTIVEQQEENGSITLRCGKVATF